MVVDGQCTRWRKNINRAHERYRRQTDGRPMTYSEPELEFTFAEIELFSLDVMAEALRVKIDRESAISLQHAQFDQNFQVEG